MTAPADEWRVVLADRNNSVITDPDETAELLADEDGQGTISIRRRTALPDEHGQLPGTWQSLDIFGEVGLDEIDVDDAQEVWQLMQAAAQGMNQATREAGQDLTDDDFPLYAPRSDFRVQP